MANLDPVVLFFILGVFARLVKSDLRIPEAFYNVLSIYLLLSIGIKGGIELFKTSFNHILPSILGTLFLGMLITFLAFFILKKLLSFSLEDSAAIAAHYGSVSAVTFAVVVSYLNDQGIFFEEYMTVLLVMLEIPAIGIAILLYRKNATDTQISTRKLVHEILFGKSMILLIGGLFIGMYVSYSGNKQLNFFFFDLFKGFLAIFMLEMGVVASDKIKDLKKAGGALIAFGIVMPLISATIGIIAGNLMGLSEGGATVLATMAASASYIAAPAAMKMAIPGANPTYYLTAALGITFPFNIVVGISLYYQLTKGIYSLF